MVRNVEEVSCSDSIRVKIPNSHSTNTVEMTEGESIFNRELPSEYTNINAKADVTDLTGLNLGACEVSCDSTPSIIRLDNPDRPFELEKDLTIKIKFGQNKDIVREITIPKGYTWDGASIPKCLQWLIGKNNEPQFAIASMVHDVICENPHAVDHNRAVSSGIFKSLLVANCVGKFKANIMSLAVDMYQSFCSRWRKPDSRELFAHLNIKRLAHAV